MVKPYIVKFTVIFAFVFTLVLFSPSASTVFGQTSANITLTIPSNSSGEDNSAITDYMGGEVRKNGGRMFIIVRLGKGENPRFNYHRLQAIKRFMSNKGINESNAVFAEGERTTGEGRIEYYLGSTLTAVTLIPHKKMPLLTCCDSYIQPVKHKLKRKR